MCGQSATYYLNVHSDQCTLYTNTHLLTNLKQCSIQIDNRAPNMDGNELCCGSVKNTCNIRQIRNEIFRCALTPSERTFSISIFVALLFSHHDEAIQTFVVAVAVFFSSRLFVLSHNRKPKVVRHVNIFRY